MRFILALVLDVGGFFAGLFAFGYIFAGSPDPTFAGYAALANEWFAFLGVVALLAVLAILVLRFVAHRG